MRSVNGMAEIRNCMPKKMRRKMEGKTYRDEFEGQRDNEWRREIEEGRTERMSS